jgi:hypothetical protein
MTRCFNLDTSLTDWDKKSTGVLYFQLLHEVDTFEELDSVIQNRNKDLKD